MTLTETKTPPWYSHSPHGIHRRLHLEHIQRHHDLQSYVDNAIGETAINVVFVRVHHAANLYYKFKFL